MRFKSEIELVEVLKETLKRTYSKENIELIDEVSLGYGIADVVVCNLVTPKSHLSRVKHILNSFDINIYNLILNEKEISFDDIIEITRNSKKRIAQTLEILIECQYISLKNDLFSIQKDYQLVFENSFAIEAKLKNWKRALQQAYRYKWFAEYSYVVLDAYYATSAIKNIDLFKKYNVGLATISTNGDLIRHFTPLLEKPFDPKMQILLSEQIKTNQEVFR
ncbi:hypothetical protein [Marinifilum sp. D714]|uniref:hypothetical protein n=1 Tax=Marinifilum sp. D714 TaxID=2937523 RepID=UPI0027BDF40C|nr:hypothetical protein [Marinifilum sp. D714]MDQ2180818.1 hypothetical protein [Marinifilum sp. D714]